MHGCHKATHARLCAETRRCLPEEALHRRIHRIWLSKLHLPEQLCRSSDADASL